MANIEFSVDRKELLAAWEIVTKSVGGRSTLPILGHILISKDAAGELRMCGTNLEQWTEYVLPESAQMFAESEQGAFTVPNGKFGDAVRTMPNGAITMASRREGNGAYKSTLKSGRSKFELLGLDPEEFPLLPEFVAKTTMVLKASDLRAALEQTVYAVSEDESRIVLTTVLLQHQKDYRDAGRVRFCATDTHRLSVRTIPFISVDGEYGSFPIPEEAARDILRLIKAADDAVTITANDSQMRLEFTNTKTNARTTLITRLVDGQYPDIDRVIPTDRNYRVEVSKEQFLAALSRAQVVASEQGSANRVVLKLHDETISIRATADVLGTTNDEVDLLQPVTVGINVEWAANVRYLLQTVASIPGENITIDIGAPLRPFVLRPSNTESAELLCVIMPMQVI
jgi:DNA polymerase III subunit beta